MKEKIMWTGILIFSLICLAISIWHLGVQISLLINTRLLVSLLILAAIFFALTKIFSLTNAIIIFIYFFIFTLIFELLTKFINKGLSRYSLLLALVISLIYFAVSYYNLHTVREKNYSLETDKLKSGETLRIVMFSDSHVGTTFSGQGLNRYVEEINKAEPDAVLIAGDFIDDSTSKQDMIDACAALFKLKTRHGTYFSFGNHDKGYYASKRGYDGYDLINELTKNQVKVLQDETVLINDSCYIIGRIDRSEEERKEMSELIKDLDRNKYMIVIDHQPNDYNSQAASQVDLVLSGHTHGGQMFPMGIIGELIGANDATYGQQKIKDTTFIVSSGISDWEILFKNGCRSEYVIIDIKGTKQ